VLHVRGQQDHVRFKSHAFLRTPHAVSPCEPIVRRCRKQLASTISRGQLQTRRGTDAIQ
jgi:hypothetical protein